MKRIQSYAAPGITVTFDPNRCIHSAVCLRTLPAVFDVRRRRWVAPEAATVPELVAAIGRCPSGALQYSLEDPAEPAATTYVTSAEDSSPEPAAEPTQPPAQATIQASMNGPLLVEGSFRLRDEQGREISSSGRAALCRCGGTGNQPFCDGSHRRVGFRSRRGEAG